MLSITLVICSTLFRPSIPVSYEAFPSSLMIPGIMTSFRILPFLIRFHTSLDDQLFFPHILAVFVHQNSVGNVRRGDFIPESLCLMRFLPPCIGVISHRRLTYLSMNLRKCSTSAYERSLVSWWFLFSSLILTNTFPVQSPGAHQLFFLSSKTFIPNKQGRIYISSGMFLQYCTLKFYLTLKLLEYFLLEI